MVFSEYYGRQSATVHLDFYSLDPSGRRTEYGALSDQEASDSWAAPRRLREILACREWAQEPGASIGDLPRPEKYLLSYLAMAASGAPTSVLELGSSLFELYDGLLAVRSSLSDVIDVDVPALEYHGVEISRFMRGAAHALHPAIQLHHHDSAEDAPERVGFLYDRMVSSFAFENVAECASFLNRADTGLLNLFVSLDETFESSWGGKTMTYFSLAQLLERLDKPLFHLFGRRAPGVDHSRGHRVVEGFFLLASDECKQEFQALCGATPDLEEFRERKSIDAVPADCLLTPYPVFSAP